jgi:hypothetical protein
MNRERTVTDSSPADRRLARTQTGGKDIITVRIGANWRTSADDGTKVEHIGWSKTEKAALRLHNKTVDEITEAARSKCPMNRKPSTRVYTLAPLTTEQWAHLRGENCGHPDCDVPVRDLAVKS